MQMIKNLAEISHLLSGGKHAVLHAGPAEPKLIADQLGEGAALWPGLNLHVFMPLVPSAYGESEASEFLNIKTLLPGAGVNDAVKTGQVGVMRDSLFHRAQQYVQGKEKCDVLFVQVSPPDKNDLVSLGISVEIVASIALLNPIIVALINPKMPRTSATISTEVIDYFLEDDTALPTMLRAAPDGIDRTVADNVLTLLDDGITLETGIGSIPEAVLEALQALRGICLHTGIINDGVMRLVQRGNISWPVVTTMAAGSEEFYSWLDGEAAIEFRPAYYTHAPSTLASLPRFHAVNGALQVALSGNVNAERLGKRIVSCPGGLPDFAAGAKSSFGGKSIIALRSTNRAGDKSTIVRELDFTTLASAMVDYVVTEYGVADLTSQDPEIIGSQMVAIAHPDHRASLAN